MTQQTTHKTQATTGKTYEERLQTGKVQLWQNGLMAGIISLDEANDLLNNAKYEIINSQAIEWRP